MLFFKLFTNQKIIYYLYLYLSLENETCIVLKVLYNKIKNLMSNLLLMIVNGV